MARALISVVAVVAALSACTVEAVPTGTLASTTAPPISAQPIAQSKASPSPWVSCGPQILVGDSTGRLLSCADLGKVATSSVAQHVANIAADPAQIRMWWTVETCASTWWLDIHKGTDGVTVMDLSDGEHTSCPAYTTGRAILLVFRPMISAREVIQLHDGVPVVSSGPHTVPPAATTFPSTPSTIQFGRWELPHFAHPGRDATEIQVTVFEKACASGHSPDGRILEPFVAYDSDSVWIAFGIWSLPGVQSCGRGPGVSYTVHLRQPLGRRQIHDGARIIEYSVFFGPDCPFWRERKDC